MALIPQCELDARAAAQAEAAKIPELPYDLGQVHGPKLARLERLFQFSLGYNISRAIDLFAVDPQMVLAPNVRAALIDEALSDQGPEHSVHSIWELIEENDWMANLGRTEQIAPTAWDLESTAHGYLAEVLRRYLNEQYESMVEKRREYTFRRSELQDN